MAGVNLTAMWRGTQQRCQFVHSVASLITFLPHHVNYLGANNEIGYFIYLVSYISGIDFSA